MHKQQIIYRSMRLGFDYYSILRILLGVVTIVITLPMVGFIVFYLMSILEDQFDIDLGVYLRIVIGPLTIWVYWMALRFSGRLVSHVFSGRAAVFLEIDGDMIKFHLPRRSWRKVSFDVVEIENRALTLVSRNDFRMTFTSPAFVKEIQVPVPYEQVTLRPGSNQDMGPDLCECAALSNRLEIDIEIGEIHMNLVSFEYQGRNLNRNSKRVW
ncbi:MAG: hypothetical protein NT027_14315 [Proteobacteria bacterium]|nr:hypothetical protein [Pseudomonadota bacterium]